MKVKDINGKSLLTVLRCLLEGIVISTTLELSVNFPKLVNDIPLSTDTHIPTSGIPLILENIRKGMDGGFGLSGSIFALLLTFFLYTNQNAIRLNKYRKSIGLYFISIIFAFFNVSGLCMRCLDKLIFFTDIYWSAASVFMIVGWSLTFYISAILLFNIIDVSLCNKVVDNGNGSQKTNIKFVMEVFVIIMTCWLVWIISYYPASMDYDVFAQLYSWMYEHNDAHPWFSTCLLGICYSIGSKIATDNVGVFIFILIRDIIIALIYAEIVGVMKKHGVPKPVYMVAIAFYSVTPFFGAYAKHAFKDTLFIGMFAASILTMYLLIKSVIDGKQSTKYAVFYGISMLLMCMLRHNGIYAILLSDLFLLVLLVIKKQRKSAFIVLLFLLCFFGYRRMVDIWISPNMDAGDQIKTIASLNFQQIARAYRDHNSELSKEEIELIDKVFYADKFAYDPVYADIAKWSMRDYVRGEEKAKYLLVIYRDLLLKYPLSYVEAAIAQTYGYYAFTPQLPEKAGNWNSGITIFDWIGCEGDFDEEFDFHYIDSLYEIRSILHAWAKVWDTIPVLCLTDECALYTWAVILSLYYCILKRSFGFCIPLIAVLFLIATSMGSAVNDCFRYFSPVAASFPVVICILAEINGMKRYNHN